MSKIYVAGAEVGRSIQKEDLEEKFSKFGRIVSCWVARQPSGFAFIEFEDQRDADDAVHEMNDKEILGCVIKVEISRGKGGKGGGDGPEVKPGDWRCDGCGVNNFARRQECFRCGRSQGGGGGRGGGYDRYDDRRGGDRYDDRGRGGYDRYDDRRGGDRYDDRGRGGGSRRDSRDRDRDDPPRRRDSSSSRDRDRRRDSRDRDDKRD